MAGLADLAQEGITVTIEGPDAPSVDPETGTLTTPTEDGGVVVSFNPGRKAADDAAAGTFDENLAHKLSDTRRSEVVEQLIEQIEADKKSRTEWMTTRAAAIDLLGLKIEKPSGDVGASSAPIEGMSTVRDPLLLEACLRAKSTASGELLPASGPVKVKNDGISTAQVDGQAEKLERGLNHWLTVVAKEYYPDTRRMLFWTVFGGCGFKKGYHCPLKRRPVIESVDAKYVIVSADATDMQTAARVTHEITMRPSIMRRMQVVGAYRDIPMTPPGSQPRSEVDEAEQRASGVRTGDERPEDKPFTLYESYCEVDINEFAPKPFRGKRVPLPFVVTLDTESREMLALRRDWEEDDDMCLRKRTWVKYPYIEALGIYGMGLMHILGNLATALTAAEREALDAGMFANFPGFFVAKWASRQQSNQIRVGPSEAVIIDTGERSIQEAIMGLPYKDVTPGLMALIDKLKAAGEKVGGTADLPVGEGKQDAPVGTTIALIEQATKIESDVHKGMHQAQSEEFEILERLLREDPEAFVDHCRGLSLGWDADGFIAALDNCMLSPMADPNTPSHIHRLMKAVALKQLQAANPQLYNAKEVDRRILTQMHYDDIDQLFAPDLPPTPPPPDPNLIKAQAAQTTAETGKQKVQLEAAGIAQNAQTKDKELAAEQQIANTRLATEQVIHAKDHGLAVDQHGLDVAGHQLDAAQAAHGATMDVASHALDVHQALNPPEPAAP